MPTPPRRSKTYTISLPPDLAEKAEALARSEDRNMSELFREAFRVYHARRIDDLFERTSAYAATRNPLGYTQADIPRLIKEVRAEQDAAELASGIAKAS